MCRSKCLAVALTLAHACSVLASDTAKSIENAKVALFDTFTHSGQDWRIYRALHGVGSTVGFVGFTT